ncbi:PREDICTED: neuron-specific vesicular protein calcyon [Bison bison bison]|uniref:Neuron-specific vesicular protein calcyon n=1 Tax=Bison bison bison TaxID=43346 RepID=A0A6P3HRZ2_BISBB|nr:PREDICTED: neuron-specific vesicular protein calcyon [Bison bison bison]
MVKLNCSFSGKTGSGDGGTMDSVPLISPLDVSQLQPSFADQVRGPSQPALETKDGGPGSFTNGLLQDSASSRGRMPTGRMIAFTMALMGCLLIMYKAIWYDQFSCPDGFLLRHKICTPLTLEMYYTELDPEHHRSLLAAIGAYPVGRKHGTETPWLSASYHAFKEGPRKASRAQARAAAAAAVTEPSRPTPPAPVAAVARSRTRCDPCDRAPAGSSLLLPPLLPGNGLPNLLASGHIRSSPVTCVDPRSARQPSCLLGQDVSQLRLDPETYYGKDIPVGPRAPAPSPGPGSQCCRQESGTKGQPFARLCTQGLCSLVQTPWALNGPSGWSVSIAASWPRCSPISPVQGLQVPRAREGLRRSLSRGPRGRGPPNQRLQNQGDP